MRISAIQNFGTCPTAFGAKKCRRQVLKNTPETKQDTVAFKAHETVKGIGIGALVGLGALTIISGGAAAPIAYGVYAAAMGTAGGMLGNAIEEVNKKDKKDEDNK